VNDEPLRHARPVEIVPGLARSWTIAHIAARLSRRKIACLMRGKGLSVEHITL